MHWKNSGLSSKTNDLHSERCLPYVNEHTRSAEDSARQDSNTSIRLSDRAANDCNSSSADATENGTRGGPRRDEWGRERGEGEWLRVHREQRLASVAAWATSLGGQGQGKENATIDTAYCLRYAPTLLCPPVACTSPICSSPSSHKQQRHRLHVSAICWGIEEQRLRLRCRVPRSRLSWYKCSDRRPLIISGKLWNSGKITKTLQRLGKTDLLGEKLISTTRGFVNLILAAQHNFTVNNNRTSSGTSRSPMTSSFPWNWNPLCD